MKTELQRRSAFLRAEATHLEPPTPVNHTAEAARERARERRAELRVDLVLEGRT